MLFSTLCSILKAIKNSSSIFCFFFQIYGDGKQTRSFQYVTDLVDGLVALMNSDYKLPVNIGNPIEREILSERHINTHDII